MPNRSTRKTRKGRTFGENTLKYFPFCLWCGHCFPAARPEAQTCKVAHRVALNRYVKKHGRPPMFPFGVKPDQKRDNSAPRAPR